MVSKDIEVREKKVVGRGDFQLIKVKTLDKRLWRIQIMIEG